MELGTAVFLSSITVSLVLLYGPVVLLITEVVNGDYGGPTQSK
jgi:hypothetical protein